MRWKVLCRVNTFKINNNPVWYNKRLINLKNRINKIYKKYCYKKDNINLKNSYLIIAKDFKV